MQRSSTVFALFLAFLLCLSCSRPDSSEQFVLNRDAAGGLYRFSLDLADSTSTYDLSFYTSEPCPGLELKVLWTGPSEQTFSETVYLEGKSQKEAYRTGYAMEEPGVWILDVWVIDEPEGFRGLGIVNRNNGTR